MAENKNTERSYLEEFLKEFPLTNYDWKLISHRIRSNIFKINKKNKLKNKIY